MVWTELVPITSETYTWYSHSQYQITYFMAFREFCTRFYFLTHWGRVTQICVDNLTTITSDYDLPLSQRQAIIWTNAGILLYIIHAEFPIHQWNGSEHSSPICGSRTCQQITYKSRDDGLL